LAGGLLRVDGEASLREERGHRPVFVLLVVRERVVVALGALELHPHEGARDVVGDLVDGGIANKVGDRPIRVLIAG
jgi:hypothetical protein